MEVNVLYIYPMKKTPKKKGASKKTLANVKAITDNIQSHLRKSNKAVKKETDNPEAIFFAYPSGRQMTKKDAKVLLDTMMVEYLYLYAGMPIKELERIVEKRNKDEGEMERIAENN